MYKQCILFLMVGLVAGGPHSRSKTESSDIPSPAYEGASSLLSNNQTEGASSSPNVSETVDHSGLLEMMKKKKEELQKELMAELQLPKLILGEEANSIAHANLKVTDKLLSKEILQEREKLRAALERYDAISNTCGIEMNLAKDDILISKKKLDEHLIQRIQVEQEEAEFLI